jgi:hypothetical protein
MWVLPRTWIGIRTRPCEGSWERVLFRAVFADAWKSLLQTTDEALTDALRTKFHSAATDGPGADVDLRIDALIAEHCTTEIQRDLAAASLVDAGVPVSPALRTAAIRGHGVSAAACVFALHEFPGKATVDALSRVVADPASDEKSVNAAASSLELIGEPAAGPSLMKALGRIRSPDSALGVVRALERLHWKEAGPLLLRRMREEENPGYRADYATALASIRYEAAIPDLLTMAGPVAFTAEWMLGQCTTPDDRTRAAMALLRMSGAWGEPEGGARLALLPPASPVLGGEITIVLVIENVGDADVAEIPIREGTAWVDGVAFPCGPGAYVGSFDLRPNQISFVGRDIRRP